MKTLFVGIVIEAFSTISEEWKHTYRPFVNEEAYIKKFAERLYLFLENGVATNFPEPHFEEEVTPPLKISYSYFAEILQEIKRNDFNINDIVKEKLTETIETTPFEHLLLLLGQRLTPASIQDERAIPPLRGQLLDSCFQPYNTEISQAARAWEKHVGRHSHSFWGEIKGNTVQKEATVKNWFIIFLTIPPGGMFFIIINMNMFMK